MTAGPDEVLDVEIPALLEGERLDKGLSLLTGVSRREAALLVAQGAVEIGGRLASSRSRVLAAGERLRVVLPRSERSPVADPTVSFEVVYEDEWLVVVDKPAGLVVHAGAGSSGPTLVSGLLARYPDLAQLPALGCGEVDRPGIVHRLDKGTSGLLVVARNPEAYRSLVAQFKQHTAGRQYRALVAGIVESEEGVVEAPIGRSARRPDRMAVSARGKPATTRYRVIARYSRPFDLTLLDATLATGRTHQVRVHLSAIGHPLVGDDRYGTALTRRVAQSLSLAHGRVFLHARRLELDHPVAGRVAWESELPDDLLEGLATLGPTETDER